MRLSLGRKWTTQTIQTSLSLSLALSRVLALTDGAFTADEGAVGIFSPHLQAQRDATFFVIAKRSPFLMF